MTGENNKKGCNNKILISTLMLASMVCMLSVSDMLGSENESILDQDDDNNNDVNNTSFYSDDNNTRNEKGNKFPNVSQYSNTNYNDQQNITESENDKRLLTNKIIEGLEGNLDFYKFLEKNGVKIKHKGCNCCYGPIDFERTNIKYQFKSTEPPFHSNLKQYIISNYCAIVNDTRYGDLNSMELYPLLNNNDEDITNEFNKHIMEVIRMVKNTHIKTKKEYEEDSQQDTENVYFNNHDDNPNDEYEMNNNNKNYE